MRQSLAKDCIQICTNKLVRNFVRIFVQALEENRAGPYALWKYTDIK